VGVAGFAVMPGAVEAVAAIEPGQPRVTPPAAPPEGRRLPIAGLEASHSSDHAFGDKSYWDNRFSAEETDEWISDYSELRDLIARACPNKASRILNLGCGISRICEKMYDDGYENIVNVDISPVAIDKMRGRNEQQRPRMEWHVADATTLSFFGDGSFDMVLDKSTLDAISCAMQTTLVVQMLAAVSRILKVGGSYLLVTLDPTNTDFLTMPHLAYDVENVSLSDLPRNLRAKSNHRACLCKKLPAADGNLKAKLPGMLAWATRFDQCQRLVPKQSEMGTPIVQQLLMMLAADSCAVSSVEDLPSYGECAYWDRRFSEEGHYEWIAEYSELQALIARACPEKTSRILMLGSGTSRLPEQLYDDGYREVVNVDISQVAIDKMKSRNDQLRSGMESHVASVADLSRFRDGHFDLVIDKGTLDSVACARQNLLVVDMLAEVSRVLKEGGAYLLVTVDPTNPDFLKMPHLSFDVETVPIHGALGMGLFMKHCACLCRCRPNAGEVLHRELPRLREAAARLDEEERRHG